MKSMIIFFVSLVILAGAVIAPPNTNTIYINQPGSDYNSQCFYQKDYIGQGASVAFTYSVEDASRLRGLITASGLKPYMTYQVKIIGKPTCIYGVNGDDSINEKIGLKGRWTCVNCAGTAAQKNRSDAEYYAYSTYRGNGSQCIQGYLVFDFITADPNGYVQKYIESDSSYHVLFCNGGVCGLTNNNFLNNDDILNGYDSCSPSNVEGQIERPSCGNISLYDSNYNVIVGLTEESFHQGMCWATVLVNDNLQFDITSGSGNGDGEPIPEFSAIAAGIALAGAGAGFFILRRRN